MRRNRILASDVRRLRGVVSVHAQTDRCSAEPIFRVTHISAGGDVAFTSSPISLEDHAAAAARVLGEFVDAREVKVVT